jgi:hypothetical protein
MKSHTVVERNSLSYLKWAAVLLLGAGMLVQISCMHSTKVYNTDKTIVYRDSIYNVSNVKVFTARTDGVVSNTQTIPLKGMDKKQFNEILKEHNPILVRQAILVDDTEIVYQAKNVDSWSQFNKMNNQFTKSAKSVQKFLADKKATQLKLK